VETKTPPTLPFAKTKDDATNDGTRDLIWMATSMICREISSSKPPLHMSRTEQGIKDWDEVEVRMRVLVKLERVWGRSAHSSPGASTSGEEQERKILMHPDAREDGFVRTSNITVECVEGASLNCDARELVAMGSDDVCLMERPTVFSEMTSWPLIKRAQLPDVLR